MFVKNLHIDTLKVKARNFQRDLISNNGLQAMIAEQNEPEVALRQMTEGHNVIEDYGHTGLTLRQHPIAFLRKDLASRNIITCAQAMNSRDGRSVYTAGLVLVRQKPGSAKGVMFITI